MATPKIKPYFKGRFDKKAVNWSKKFKFSMTKVPENKRSDFRRDIRTEFAIAKSDIIINTPIDSGALVNNMKVSFAYDGQNFVVTVADNRIYTHYQNSGTPQFTGNTGFITDALMDFDMHFARIVKEYEE